MIVRSKLARLGCRSADLAQQTMSASNALPFTALSWSTETTTIHYGSGTAFFNGDMRSNRVMLHRGLAVSVQLRAQ